MKIIDISMPIHEDMAVWGNLEPKKPKMIVSSDFSTAKHYETDIHMNLHTGTHLDMPLHMIPGGATSESLDIARLVTRCTVLDLTHVKDKVSAGDLMQKEIGPGSFILLKTRNSFTDGFDNSFVFVDATGAEYLKEKKINGVGIDNLGIERAQPEHETHKTLLGNGIIVLEGLRLAEVPEGNYQMVALPLYIRNVEALPARVILME